MIEPSDYSIRQCAEDVQEYITYLQDEIDILHDETGSLSLYICELQEKIRRLNFMVDEGLGPEDMEVDFP